MCSSSAEIAADLTLIFFDLAACFIAFGALVVSTSEMRFGGSGLSVPLMGALVTFFPCLRWGWLWAHAYDIGIYSGLLRLG